jgi:CubicO group peptidase (beta-lactamase class C family)
MNYRLLLPIIAAGLLAGAAVSAASHPVGSIIDEITPPLMEEWKVPGVSVALIEDFRVTWTGQYGVKTATDPRPVTAETIFEAASMSKPAYAYVVMHLVKEGIVDLDTPLVEYLGRDYLEDEPLHRKMTARMVLSHTTGFPNWRPGGRRGGGPIPVYFEPGSQFRYSGEGFLFLQTALEELTGMSAEERARKYLFEPLGMKTSSYVWREDFAGKAAAGHTEAGEIPERARSLYRTPNTAFTLYTTPSDYALFLIEMMQPATSRLGEDLHRSMLARISTANTRSPIQRGAEPSEADVFFGLGWRIEALPSGDRFCHSGSNGTGFRCYSEFNPETGQGIVIMTNSASGLHVWQGIMRAVGQP